MEVRNLTTNEGKKKNWLIPEYLIPNDEKEQDRYV